MSGNESKDLRKITILLDREVYDEVEEYRERLGVMKRSEIYRIIITKGLETLKKELTVEMRG